MLTVGVSQAGGSRERGFAVLPSSSKGWSTKSQDVSSGWWKNQEGERGSGSGSAKKGVR